MAKKHVNDRARNTQDNRDNRANQLNPNNNAYWKTRGYDRKPGDRSNARPKRENKD